MEIPGNGRFSIFSKSIPMFLKSKMLELISFETIAGWVYSVGGFLSIVIWTQMPFLTLPTRPLLWIWLWIEIGLSSNTVIPISLSYLGALQIPLSTTAASTSIVIDDYFYHIWIIWNRTFCNFS